MDYLSAQFSGASGAPVLAGQRAETPSPASRSRERRAAHGAANGEPCSVSPSLSSPGAKSSSFSWSRTRNGGRNEFLFFVVSVIDRVLLSFKVLSVQDWSHAFTPPRRDITECKIPLQIGQESFLSHPNLGFFAGAVHPSLPSGGGEGAVVAPGLLRWSGYLAAQHHPTTTLPQPRNGRGRSLPSSI